jgi:hypothetical protein
VTFDDWRDRLSGTGLRERLVAFEEWLNSTFNISMDSFRLFEGPPVPFAPEGNVNMLMAQQPSPAGNGVWTLATAPSGASLDEGMRALASQANWRQLDGRLTTFDSVEGKLSSLPVGGFRFVETQPFSLSNYRLIVANWLSANALFYSIALTILSILLGLATAGLLGSLGRRK